MDGDRIERSHFPSDGVQDALTVPFCEPFQRLGHIVPVPGRNDIDGCLRSMDMLAEIVRPS